MTAGEVLVHNTAARKYLVSMVGAHKKYEPFDPTVATSPLISYWVPSDNCPMTLGKPVPIYAVDPSKIDQDPVMDRILAQARHRS